MQLGSHLGLGLDFFLEIHYFGPMDSAIGTAQLHDRSTAGRLPMKPIQLQKTGVAGKCPISLAL
jgi:hypothetical protein